MLSCKQTHQQQSKLALYCRTGTNTGMQGIHPEKIAQYRRLIIHMVDDVLQNAFPLTYNVLKEEEWDTAVHTFFSQHKCCSPQVWYMPKEFYLFLSETQHPLLLTYPFLEELLHFEWAEIELFMMPDQPIDCKKEGDILKEKLVLNPEHQLFCFEFPVHLKNAGTINPNDQGRYYAIAYRDRNGDVQFADLSPALVRMMEYLQEQPQSITDLLDAFQTEFDTQLQPAEKQLLIHFFENAQQQHLISGFKL